MKKKKTRNVEKLQSFQDLPIKLCKDKCNITYIVQKMAKIYFKYIFNICYKHMSKKYIFEM